jgi:hypothetical protein
MKFRPTIGQDLSGSLGGITASRNKGGTYFRGRVIPVNPGTVFQQVIRTFVAQLTSLWANTLTEAQRLSWDNYALQVPITDRIGEPRNIGGIAQYVRSNVPRLQVALARVDTAPTIFNLGDYSPPSIASVTAPTAFSIAFEAADDWANEDGAAMLLFTSRGMNPTINFFKGPYRSVAGILGDGITPETSPFAAVGAFPLLAGQRAFIRAAVTRADGRLSSSFRTADIVV